MPLKAYFPLPLLPHCGKSRRLKICDLMARGRSFENVCAWENGSINACLWASKCLSVCVYACVCQFPPSFQTLKRIFFVFFKEGRSRELQMRCYTWFVCQFHRFCSSSVTFHPEPWYGGCPRAMCSCVSSLHPPPSLLSLGRECYASSQKTFISVNKRRRNRDLKTCLIMLFF